MDHLNAKVFGQDVTLRDLVETDVERLVSYWHDTDRGFLYSLGADLSKLDSRDRTRERILDSLNTRIPRTKAYFVIASEQELLAYTNLNFRSELEACAHFHVLKRTARVKAIMYVLSPEVFRVFFSCFPLERIEMQTLTENTNIARLLKRLRLKGRQEFLDQPDGLGRAGHFNIYELTRTELGLIKRPL